MSHVLSQAVLLQNLFSERIDEIVIVVACLIALLVDEGVAGRIVEYHDVVEFYISQALDTAIVPVRPLYVAFHVDQRHGVLGKGHGEWGLWNTWTIAYLAYEEVVAREKALLQRRRRDDVVLEEEEIDEVDGYKGKDERVNPAHDKAYGALGIFPPLPAYLFGDIDIVDKGHDNKAEPTLYPEQEGKIEDQHDSELGPLHLHIEFLFLFVDH